MAVTTPSPLSVVAASAALTTLGSVAVALRFWARYKQQSSFRMDDWLVIPAALLTIGMAAALIKGVRLHALGYPTTTSHKASVTQQIEWAVQMMQTLQLGFIKLSFLFFFRKIFVVSKSSKFGIATSFMIVLVALWTASFFLAFLFACGSHLAAWWGPAAVFRRECIGLDFENGFALSDFIMDAIIIFMPLPMVWRLQMSTQRKLAVTAIFALGLLAVIASIVRLAIFYHAKAVAFKGGVDNDLLITEILFWSMIESVLALLAVCLPIVHSLFRKGSLESVVRSVRSLVSLASGSRHSQESRHSRPSHTTVNRAYVDGNFSTASHARIIPTGVEPSSVESYAMSDIPKKPNDQENHREDIFVSSTLEQTHHAV